MDNKSENPERMEEQDVNIIFISFLNQIVKITLTPSIFTLLQLDNFMNEFAFI